MYFRRYARLQQQWALAAAPNTQRRYLGGGGQALPVRRTPLKFRTSPSACLERLTVYSVEGNAIVHSSSIGDTPNGPRNKAGKKNGLHGQKHAASREEEHGGDIACFRYYYFESVVKTCYSNGTENKYIIFLLSQPLDVNYSSTHSVSRNIYYASRGTLVHIQPLLSSMLPTCLYT